MHLKYTFGLLCCWQSSGRPPARRTKFRSRYRDGLKTQRTSLQPLRDALKRGPATLVYSAHDEAQNQAVVLREYLLKARPSSRQL